MTYARALAQASSSSVNAAAQAIAQAATGALLFFELLVCAERCLCGLLHHPACAAVPGAGPATQSDTSAAAQGPP